MLMTNEPLHTLTRKHDNCTFLHDEVFPFVDRFPDRLYLDSYHHKCGSRKCLLGWYEELRYGDQRLSEGGNIEVGLFMGRIKHEFRDYMQGHYIIDADKNLIHQFTDVFGNSDPANGSMEVRKRYVSLHVKTLAREIGALV